MTFLPTNTGMQWENTLYPVVLMVLFAGVGACLLISYFRRTTRSGGLTGGIISCIASLICLFVTLGIAGSQGGNINDANRAANVKQKYAIEAYLKTERYDRDKQKVEVAINGQLYTFWLHEDPQSFEPVLISDEKVSAYDISRLKK